MDISHMTPRRPYILRAIYDWLVDNELTPHLIVNVIYPGVQVPMELARDGRIVLNIAPQAVANLKLGDAEVHFSTRFSGVARPVVVPLGAVQAIYSRENGAGTLFEQETAYAEERRIERLDNNIHPGGSLISIVDSNRTEISDGDEPPPSGGRRPVLRVVK
ncbi:Stringent starvation protein B [Serratia symbiotica]|nr:Stringent starvation protein B [Serratia symbiotica]